MNNLTKEIKEITEKYNYFEAANKPKGEKNEYILYKRNGKKPNGVE